MKSITYFLLFLLLSCKQKKKEDFKTFATKENKQTHVNDFKNCKPTDTILKNKNAVRYIVKDTSFDIEVNIKSKNSFLGFGFDCTAPPALIPFVYATNETTICLKRGYSQDFREFIICHLNNDSIITKHYEIALDFNPQTNTVAYRNYDSGKYIYVENIFTSKRKIFVLEKDKDIRIISASLQYDKLFLGFSNDKKTQLSLK